MGNYHPHGDQCDLRRARAHGPGLLAALPARSTATATSARPTDAPGRHALHRVPAGAARDGAARRDRRGHRRLQPTPTTASTDEPVVLPARFPNLLVNGGGRASRSAWPPTSRRTTSARSSTRRVHLIDNPDATLDDLMQFVKGPDFPTGGADPRARRASTTPTAPAAARSACAAVAEIEEGRKRRAAHRRHRGAVPDVGRGDRREDRRARQRPQDRRHPRRPQRVGRATPALVDRAASATPTRRSCSTTSTSTRRCRRTSR